MIEGTWTGKHGITVDYSITPGEAQTYCHPGTAPECVIEAIYRDGVEVDEFLDVLEGNGIDVYEKLQKTIIESQTWRD